MNQKALKTLEYFKIINMLTELAYSAPGKELCKTLLPLSDMAEIMHEQHETSDALTRLVKNGSLSFSGVYDILGSLKRLELGASLSIEELLHIGSLLETAARVKSYLRQDIKSDTDNDEGDALQGMCLSLEPLTPVSSEISRCIVSEEYISDDASSTLRHIRKSIAQSNDKIHSQLNSMVNSSNTRTYLQDALVTMRNGRYCLPVKSEYRGQLPGMIHDQSSTGSTLFVEPMAVVKLNNELKELALREQEEIIVILASLSQFAGEHIEELATNLELLAKLDFIFAKAKLSRDMNGSEPIFNTNGYINIKKGRHPLLQKQNVVPIDIHVGKDFHLLIVTGPNTGGKTVSLKTVGLFSLMGQAGLHIPAFDQSELALFDEIYADIGDEQSIEQSLSTFSSHMTNIVSILDTVTPNSLVLFDELGAGTDPTEGAALAISILSYLHSMGTRTMATTHYSEIKVYALSTEGVENASCEFDVETLRPTYRLLIGIPGKSNAFAISGKLGLPDFIIQDAKSRINSDEKTFEDLITSLETNRKTIEKEQESINQYKSEVEQLKKKLETKQERLESSREKILREANEKAQTILREAKDFADYTIKNFHKYGSGGNSIREMENERNLLREKLDNVEKNLVYKNNTPERKSAKPKDLHIGDSVKVTSMNLNGTISTLPNQRGDMYVQMGILRSLVNIKDIILLDEPVITAPNIQKTGSGKIKMSKTSQISSEIKLIGKTVDEALPLLDKYLDDAYLSHIPSVRVVHGKGTGALRNAVHQHLKRLNYVKSYRLGVFGEGEAGVTIVEFQ